MNPLNNEHGRVTVLAKLLIVAVVVGGGFFILKKGAETGLIPTPGIMKSLIPQKAELPSVQDAKVANVTPIALPGSSAASVSANLIRGSIWEWNAQMGLMLANGGAQTTDGSILAKRNVNLLLSRQDDTGKMQEELIACAKEIHDGSKQCSSGANFVIIMGDGAGQFIAAVNPQLKKINDSLEVIGSVGYSRGEDAFMAPPRVKLNADAAKGLLVAGVLRDGDWNIAMKWAADNNIKNNPDEKTYDLDAINWINSADYNQAAADYVAGKCDDRKVVKDGHPTGETRKVCVNAIVTWTPGDVTAVEKKGGLVKVVSSREYRSQMPATIVILKTFANANRDEVVNLLAGIFEGGDQVKAFPQALKKAAEISAKVYNDQDGAYWERYYKGVAETDREGNKVDLGGSAVNNLADNLILYGLQPGANDNFKSTYSTFAAIAVQQYPDLFKDTPIPDSREAVDKSFITAAQAVMQSPGAAADEVKFVQAKAGAPMISHRDYHITFDTGKATLTSEGRQQLSKLKDNLAITGLYIQVDGFTDNTGDEQRTNLPLSRARAETVKQYLQAAAPENFPDSRFEVSGHGSLEPVAPNSTAQGRAENRRVKITLKE